MGPPAEPPASKRARRDPSPARGNAHNNSQEPSQDRTTSPRRQHDTTDDDAKVDEGSPTHPSPNGATAGGGDGPFARLTGTQDDRAIDLLRVITTASLQRTERVTPKLAKALSQWGRHVSLARADLGSTTLPGPNAVVAWAKRLNAHSAGPRIGQFLMRPLLQSDEQWDLAPVWAEIMATELHDAGAFADGGVDEGPLAQSIRDALEKARGLKDLRRKVATDAAHLLPQVDESIAIADEALIMARSTLEDAKATNAACMRIKMSLPPASTATAAGATDFLAQLHHLNAGTGGAATLSDQVVDSILEQARTDEGPPSFTAALGRIGAGDDAAIDVSQEARDAELQQQLQQQRQPLDRSTYATDDETTADQQQPQHQVQQRYQQQHQQQYRTQQQAQRQPQHRQLHYRAHEDAFPRRREGVHHHASAPAYDPSAPAYRQPFEPTTIHTDDFVYAGEEVDAMGGRTLCGRDGLQSTRIRPSKGAPSRSTRHEIATHGYTYYQSAVGNCEPLCLTGEVAPAGFLARRYTTSSAQAILNDIVQTTQHGTRAEGGGGRGRLSASQRLQQLQDQLDGALPHLQLSTAVINKDSIVTLLSRGKLHVLSENLEHFLPVYRGREPSVGIYTPNDLYMAIENLRAALVEVHGVRGSASVFGFGLSQLATHFQERLETILRGDVHALLYIFQEAAREVEAQLHAFTINMAAPIPSFHPEGPLRHTLQQVLSSGVAWRQAPSAGNTFGGGEGPTAPSGGQPICRKWCRDHAQGRVPAGAETCGNTFGPDKRPCRFTHPAVDQAIAAASAHGW